MDPKDFLAVAERFRTSAVEAERRTSIGRSYYALFNFLVEVLTSKGVIFREIPDDHHMLIRYLSRADNKAAASVGAAVRDLRNERNRADYNLKIHITAKSSDFLYQKAIRAVGQFEQIPKADMELIIRNIQALP